jgi:hypothetical protein
VCALQVGDLVKISEVCYDPSELPETTFEFVELFNAGSQTVFLDGAVLSDQGNNNSNETTFQFPGTPLTGTTIPLGPGEFVFIVGSATGSSYAGIDWEFFGAGADTDDPAVPNLVKTSGLGNDLGLANTGDGLTLSVGISSGNVIPCNEIVDGASWEDGGGIDEVTSTSRLQCTDPAAHPGVGDGPRSLQRRQNGNDTDRSADDFGVAVRTPGGPAACVLTAPCVADLRFAPCVPQPNLPVTVSLRITTAPAGWTGKVFHKLEAAASYDSTVMTLAVEDSTLSGTVPGHIFGSRVLYWVRATDADGNHVAVPTGGAAAPAQYHVGLVTIASIQGNVVADSCASSALRGKAVAIRGVVTHEPLEFDAGYFYVQRGTGPNSGIRIATSGAEFAPSRGDSVQIAGLVEEVDCQTQIVLFDACGQVVGTHRTVVPRTLTSPAQVALEENEGMLVRLVGPMIVATEFDTTGTDVEFRIESGSNHAWVGTDTFSPDLIGYTYVPKTDDVLDAVTGIVSSRRPNAADPVTRLRLEPRRDYDVDREFSDIGEPPAAVVRRVRVGRNIPNPFNPATTIEYELATDGGATLRIYDAAGRAVRTLVAAASNIAAGTHRVVWDGRDDAGTAVSSGLYVVRLESNGRTATRKLVLLR